MQLTIQMKSFKHGKTLICINVTIVPALQSKTLQKMKLVKRWNVFHPPKHKFNAFHKRHKSWLNFVKSSNIWFYFSFNIWRYKFSDKRNRDGVIVIVEVQFFEHFFNNKQSNQSYTESSKNFLLWSVYIVRLFLRDLWLVIWVFVNPLILKASYICVWSPKFPPIL